MKKLLAVLLFVVVSGCKSGEPNKINIRNWGEVFGTTYSIIYQSEQDFQKSFDSIFNRINLSLSTYIPDSDISRINKGEAVMVDEHFKRVFERSKDIFNLTQGKFDPTIGAVVNAWDFGPEGKIVKLDSSEIDRLMTSVGLEKVSIVDKRVTKPDGTYLDFNAIAKGYGVDAVAEFLLDAGVDNFLVEIGGEIRVSGINKEKNATWVIGIDRPNFDGTKSVMATLQLENGAMATSGTYRKFKIDKNGNRYAHIIDTDTGYPSKTNILSVSVIAPDCMTADAYATAFQAMGLEKVRHFLSEKQELKVFLVLENAEKELETVNLNDFPIRE